MGQQLGMERAAVIGEGQALAVEQGGARGRIGEFIEQTGAFDDHRRAVERGEDEPLDGARGIGH
ncbi:hypothetical protein, partial [Salinisphaera orenii]|uniref:hypothetical protein n=1 Tax=Salinisphaera orenii TaxID=856731 RepID=UPI001C849674